MSRIAVILALPLEYSTSSMLRCRSIICALRDAGHQLTCFAPQPDINSKYYSADSWDGHGIATVTYAKAATADNAKTTNIVGNISIKRQVKDIARSLFRKVDVFGSTLLYLPKRKFIAQEVKKGNYDILVSFSDPMPAHMIGKYCKQRNRNIWYIQQWGDPLASDTISKTAQPVWIRKLIENSLLNPADRICYVSPFTRDEQASLFPRHAKKMVFLPTPSISYPEEKTVNQKTNPALCVGYFGSYNSSARNLLPFYKAAQQHPEIQFRIIGDSDLSLEPCGHITILQRIPPDQLNEYVRETDVLVCLMNHKGNQIPGKVYHDASLSKDILLIKDGEYGDAIQEFFEKYEHYTFVENDADSISAALEKYQREGVPVRRPVEAFSAKNVAEKLIEQ